MELTHSDKGKLLEGAIQASLAATQLSNAATLVLSATELAGMPQLEWETRVAALHSALERTAGLALAYEEEMTRLKGLTTQLSDAIKLVYRHVLETPAKLERQRILEALSSPGSKRSASDGSPVVTAPHSPATDRPPTPPKPSTLGRSSLVSLRSVSFQQTPATSSQPASSPPGKSAEAAPTTDTSPAPRTHPKVEVMSVHLELSDEQLEQMTVHDLVTALATQLGVDVQRARVTIPGTGAFFAVYDKELRGAPLYQAPGAAQLPHELRKLKEVLAQGDVVVELDATEVTQSPPGPPSKKKHKRSKDGSSRKNVANASPPPLQASSGEQPHGAGVDTITTSSATGASRPALALPARGANAGPNTPPAYAGSPTAPRVAKPVAPSSALETSGTRIADASQPSARSPLTSSPTFGAFRPPPSSTERGDATPPTKPSTPTKPSSTPGSATKSPAVTATTASVLEASPGTVPSDAVVHVSPVCVALNFNTRQLATATLGDLKNALMRRIDPESRILQILLTVEGGTPRLVYRSPKLGEDAAQPSPPVPDTASLAAFGFSEASTVSMLIEKSGEAPVATARVPLRSTYAVDLTFTEDQLRSSTLASLCAALQTMFGRRVRFLEHGGRILVSDAPTPGSPGVSTVPTDTLLSKLGFTEQTSVTLRLE